MMEMFSVVDDVFTEDDAMITDQQRRVTLGRIYEQWQRTREQLDPGWKAAGKPRRAMTRRAGERMAAERRERQVDGELG